MVKNKLIAARKARNITQSDMAEKLFISQSQYQRRERGEVCISDDEWARMAKLLDKKVEEIKETDNITTINNYESPSGDYYASNNYFYNIPEFIMKNQQEYIEMLKEKIRQQEQELNRIKETKA